jgi:hypothetical protein
MVEKSEQNIWVLFYIWCILKIEQTITKGKKVVHFSSVEKDGTKENITEQGIPLYFVPYGKNYSSINAPIGQTQDTRHVASISSNLS